MVEEGSGEPPPGGGSIARHVTWQVSLMSLRQYFKSRDGLPDPKGSLSSRLPSLAIASANREVQKVLEKSQNPAKKRGPYKK